MLTASVVIVSVSPDPVPPVVLTVVPSEYPVPAVTSDTEVETPSWVPTASTDINALRSGPLYPGTSVSAVILRTSPTLYPEPFSVEDTSRLVYTPFAKVILNCASVPKPPVNVAV